jgi:uncharacterized protein (DUF433 family)
LKYQETIAFYFYLYDMNKWKGYIELNPAVMMGKPIIKGTRIAVETIIDELASGYTEDDVLKAHPRLTKEHILAALQYASMIIKNEKIFPVAS